MSDEQRSVTVNMRVRYALWPGDGVFCVVAEAEKIGAAMWLHDRDDRTMELRPYRFGMFGDRR